LDVGGNPSVGKTEYVAESDVLFWKEILVGE
jgi:hypothetical protein